MPKLRESAEKTKITQFKAAISKALILQSMSKDELAQALHMSRSSLWSKLNHPDEFRLGELKRLFSLLDIDDSDKQILF